MSQANVEAVHEMLAAFNSGEIERILALADPAFEAVITPALSAEPDTYRGHDGIRRYFSSFAEVMDDIRFVPERFWDAGESVVVAARLTAKGRRTQIPVEQEISQLWTIREGAVARVVTYRLLAEALDAAGLQE
jgi:ketosteroid isomerase-like protein